MYKYLKFTKIISRKEFILLIVILALGFVLRLYKLGNPVADWHSFRQADTASVTRLYLDNGLNLLIPKYQDISRVQSGIFNPNGYRFVEFPVYNAIHFFFVKYIGIFSIDVWGRLLSVIFAEISAVFIFLIGKKIYGRAFGLLSMAVFLFIPFNIYFTRVILPEPLAISLTMASLYFFLKYIDEENSGFLVTSAVLFSLGVLTKPYVLFYGFPVCFYFLQKFGFRKIVKLKQIYLYSLIVIIPFLLWRLWMTKFPEGIPFWKWTLNGDGIRFRPAFWRWIFGERLGYLILGLWGILPFSVGVANLKKKDWFIISSLLGMLAYVCIIATANVRHDYYQSIIIPAVSFSVAYGILSIWSSLSKSFIKKILFLFSILLALLMGLTQIREYYKINRPEIIDAGREVDRLTPKDALVIAAYNGDTAFLYQTKRRGWPVVELPIDELIDEGASYYTSVDLNDGQTIRFMKTFKIIEKTDKFVILDLKEKTTGN